MSLASQVAAGFTQVAATIKGLRTQATIASSGTPTPTGDARNNELYVTALAAGATFAAPSGTPANGNSVLIRVKDNGTAQALSWNATYRAVGVTLPTTTVAGKVLYVGAKYSSPANLWHVIAVGQEA